MRIVISMISLVLCVFLYSSPVAAQAPTAAEIRVNTMKYLKALQAKGYRVDAFNAKQVLKYLKTHPKAALGMYIGYKPAWDKKLGWQETKSQKDLKEIRAKVAAAYSLLAPTESNGFKRYELAWRRIEGDTSYHLRTFCTGKSDNTCGPAKAFRDMAVRKVLAAWNLGMSNPRISFDAIQDQIIDGEREPLYAVHMKNKLSKWVPQLAREKKLYWKTFLSSKGGLKKWAKQEKLVKCVPLRKKGGRSLNYAHLNYLYGNKDKVFIRCEFLRAPSKWDKYEQKPYWRVSLRWAGRWESLLTYPVRRPSRTSLVHWKWNASDLKREINRKAAATKFTYPGKWARVQVEYIYPWILKYVWRGGHRVPVWRYPAKAGTSFYLKWR